MKALIFRKPNDVRVETVKDPTIENAQDAILRVTSTAITGSDLQIYHGLFPQITKRVLGREFMGIVEDTGSDVETLRRGDRVVVSSLIACGQCWFCSHQQPTACTKRWPPPFLPGGQAEYVRVPYADYSSRKIRESLKDDQVLLLADTVPTGWAAVEWGNVKRGDTVAVFGCGPVGLMAQKLSWLHRAKRVIGIDIQEYRLRMAQKVASSETIHAQEWDPVEVIRSMTEGRGADVCIDAVGTTEVSETALNSVRRGGSVSIVGACEHDRVSFPIKQIFEKGVQLRAGRAPVQNYMDKLLALVEDKKILAEDIITHRLPLEEAPHAYEIMSAMKENSVKAVFKL